VSVSLINKNYQKDRKMKLFAAFFASTMIAGVSYAKSCDITVEATDSMSYSTKVIAAAGCTEIKLTLKHTGKLPKAAMGHNLAIAAEADMKDVIAAATKSGFAKDYSPGTDHVIAATKLLGGGESDTITIATSKFKKGTKYKFFCTFPGHSAIMLGDVTL
jgi:azurin